MNAKAMETQSNIMHQSNTLRDSLKGLHEWEQEIKELEKKQKSETKSHQPIRSQTKPTNGTSTSDAADFIKSPEHERAAELKNKGNDCVKKGEYKKAIHFYTEAIRTYKFDAVFFTNRALCYLKLKQYVDCIEDCSIAVQLDPVCVKAYYRRMQANEAMSNINEALSDCRKVLQLDANNKDAKRSEDTLLEKLQRMTKVKPVPKKEKNDQRNSSIKKATTNVPAKVAKTDAVPWSPELPGDIRLDFVDCAPHLRSQQSLQKLEIRDVQEFEDVMTPKAVTLESGKSNLLLLNNNEDDEIEPVPSVRLSISPVRVTKPKIVEILPEKADEPEVEEREIFEQKPTKSAKLISTLSTAAPQRTIAAPKTTTEFHMAWASLTSDVDRFELLQQCADKDFSKLLGSQFTSEMLSEILAILQQRFVCDRVPVGNILNGILSNAEMKIIAFMLSNEEKLEFTQLVEYMRIIGEKEELINIVDTKFNSILS